MTLARIKRLAGILIRDPKLFFTKARIRFQRMRNHFLRQYFQMSGQILPPTELSFCLTQKCNLRCPMCGQWGDHGRLKKEKQPDELNLAELQKIVDETAPFKPNVSIWGGEPMLRPDLFDFIQYIKSKGLICSMVTNGTMLLTHAENLVASGLDYLYISLDGPERVHDTIRGKGIFQKVVAGLKRVHQIRDQQKKDFPKTRINSLIMGSTYRHMEEMLQIGQELGVNSLSFSHAWAIPEEMGARHAKVYQQLFGCEAIAWKGFLKDKAEDMDLDELVKIIRNLDRKRDTIKDFTIGFLPHMVTEVEIKRYYHDVSYTPRRTMCHSPWFRADIRPNGDLNFCLDYPDYIVGNVREASFFTLWKSPKANAFRKALCKYKKFPICSQCCQMYLD